MIFRKGNKDTLPTRPFYFTRRFFVIFGVGSVLLVALYFFVDSGIALPISFDVTLLLAAVVDYFLAPSSKRVTIERSVPYPLAVGKKNTIPLLVTNLNDRAVTLRVMDDTPRECPVDFSKAVTQVPPGSGFKLKYNVTPTARGVGAFGNVHFWVKGSLGLVWKHGESPAQADIKLYPGLALIERHRLKLRRAATDNMIRPIAHKGQGSDFDSLRDYTPGDDPRLINWAATAKKGRPIVRQNRMERSQNVFLVLDAGRMMTAKIGGRSKLDYAIDAALLLAYGALELGDYVGIMVLAQDPLCMIPPAKGAAHFGKILDSIYTIQPRFQETRFHLAFGGIASGLKKRSLVILFTDLIDERASLGLKRYVLSLMPRHLPFVAAMADTEVIALADSTPATKRDVYRQGVASELLDRRERLLASFAFTGALITDVSPGDISAAVLDRYLDIKAGARL